ncbi:hypothetical protein PG991_014538 [Apiospora marii]|uniref:SprT-like domain-containing protein n=1 Tax=Apiospora marii TaxID=335849 RepID=A0ABR1R3S3_9PEZI
MRSVEDRRMLLKIRDGTSPPSLMAASSWRKKDKQGEAEWNAKSPEVITLSPGYLKSLQNKGFPRYSKELINNARLDTVNKAAAGAAGQEIESSIDLLNTLKLTLLHEISHLGLMKWAIDKEEPRCYTWDNAVRLQTCRNAEIFALFIVVSDLIKNHGLRVTASGMIEPI